MTAIEWSDGAPIYRQLKERVVAMLLDGILKPGDALPSVRQVAAEYQLNPITVSRAYQELADEALGEQRRGLGRYVADGAGGVLGHHGVVAVQVLQVGIHGLGLVGGGLATRADGRAEQQERQRHEPHEPPRPPRAVRA